MTDAYVSHGHKVRTRALTSLVALYSILEVASSALTSRNLDPDRWHIGLRGASADVYLAVSTLTASFSDISK